MRVTVVCKNSEWQVRKLEEAALPLGIDLDVRDITVPDVAPDNLGDIVLWRSSSLGVGPERSKMMGAIQKKSLLINRCLVTFPHATEKAFQQEYIKQQAPSIPHIPTFRFDSKKALIDSVDAGTLRYPFIQKPNRGSKGQGVELIKNREDLDCSFNQEKEQVYQNFIKNSGDYRVLVLGGRILGAIKRTSQNGGFLNNISQGGIAEAVTDPKVLAKLRRIGTTAASVFELALCGIDIIYDDREGKYFFLEANTVPQWRGFQEATGVDVAKEILSYCTRMFQRGKRETPALVSDEYHSQLHLLGNKRFHFLSRLYAWTRDPLYKNFIDDIRSEYIGHSEMEYRKKLKDITAKTPERESERTVAKEARKVFFKKYPDLEPFLNLLFKNLFAKEMYGVDFRPYIRELVRDEEFVALKNALEQDEEAMRILSTHAINYLYLLDTYLGDDRGKINLERYLQIGESYPDNFSELQIYFFTHCIIGASKFYNEKIRKEDLPMYTSMLEASEKIIEKNFQTISLDNKFEFLVCARMCQFQSTVEKNILLEAEKSLSPDGNFLIDTLNTKAAPNERNDFVGAEHRNVLFIMSQIPSHYQR